MLVEYLRIITGQNGHINLLRKFGYYTGCKRTVSRVKFNTTILFRIFGKMRNDVKSFLLIFNMFKVYNSDLPGPAGGNCDG